MQYGWKYILFFIACSLLVFDESALAQQKDWRKPKGLSSTNQKQLADDEERISFTNLNSGKTYYHNNRKLKRIRKLEEQQDFKKMIEELEEYVSNFGSANFGRDAELLWLLGQLYENFGKMSDAKWLYSLVLKHANGNTRIVKQYYDNQKRLKEEHYVPIDYYYKLVDYRKRVDTIQPPKGEDQYVSGQVNSPYDDYGPSLSITDTRLLFASKRNRVKTLDGQEMNEDLFWAEKKNGEWGKAKPFKALNSRYNEGAPCLSRDGQTIYFARCDAPDGYGDCDLYRAKKQTGGGWGNATNLGEVVNSERWDSHPSLSHSGDTLFFASNRDGGFGSNDIYFTYKNKKGQWAPPQNLGPTINTKGNDISPFYHPEHDVLYFSSNGQLLNFGNFDIYKAYRKDGGWTEPKNIGPLVNTKGNEHFFTIDSESDKLFYSRSDIQELGENANLYTFPLPMGGQPKARTTVKGTVKDSISGEPFDGIVSVIDKETGIEVAPQYLREDGSFKFQLIKDKEYLFVIRGDDFFRVEKNINLKSDTSISIKTPSINYVQLQFESIEFATNSAELEPEMKPDLDKLMDFLLDHPDMKLKISGHTDARGDSVLNYKLSQARADAIKDYIMDKGKITQSRISAKGYGSNQPLIKDPENAQERSVNRRVEFKLMEKKNEKVTNRWD